MGQVKEAQRQTITRRSDEPKLEIDDVVPIREGVVGVVVARYTAPGDERQDIHYVLELRPDGSR